MPKMTDNELKSLLGSERRASLGGTLMSDLSTERARALSYYNGDMQDDMPAPEGRSQAISTDVSDTIDGLMPSLMEIFAAGDQVVKFEPVGPEDEAAAEQESDYVNHVFMQQNSGFLAIYTFVKDALLSKNGIVKVFWDKTDRYERETYLDQSDAAFMMLVSDPDAEVVEHTETKDEDTGEVLHDVTIMKKKNAGFGHVMNVPPEEFGISKFARSIRDCNYCFHEPQNVTQTDLIEQGYDETQISELPTYTLQNRQEQDARSPLHEDQVESENINKAVRRIKVVEHYVRMDYEGNGEPALYKVTTGGEQLEILIRKGKPDIVMIDEIPFAAMTPVIITHRFFGRSIADLVMDIQRIKTALIRQMLDNAYFANNQRLQVAENMAHERTIDDLLVNRPAAIVRVKQIGAIEPIPNQPIGEFAFPLMEYVDQTREWRTGVTRQAQGIDANALQNQSATAVAQIYSAAQAKMKLIARIFAETGIRDMFLLLHGVIRKNDSKANTIRLRNQWVTVDPRNWKTRTDMTVNVGLGTGGRAEQVANLMQVLNVQKEIIQSQNPTLMAMVQPKNLYNTVEKLVERMGLKNAQPYFTDPTTVQQQPQQGPPPDPKAIAAQGQVQVAQQRAQDQTQLGQQKLQQDAQLKIRQQDLEAQLERERQQTDARTDIITSAINGHMRNATRPVQLGGQTG